MSIFQDFSGIPISKDFFKIKCFDEVFTIATLSLLWEI